LSRLHPVQARQVIRFLEPLGFVQVQQKGSHKFFRHQDGRTVTVPEHKGEDLGRGILAKILRDAGVKPGEFLAWLS
jgi:predicted RNA binding protein YcfA (HicA-like mRNA interferase family)